MISEKKIRLAIFALTGKNPDVCKTNEDGQFFASMPGSIHSSFGQTPEEALLFLLKEETKLLIGKAELEE